MPANAVHDDNLFELDKNVTNNLDATKIGVLDGNVTASAPSLTICQSAAAPQSGSTVLIDGERILLGANSAGTGGGCPGTKVAYAVTRAQGGTSAGSHSKGEDVTKLVVVSKPGNDWDQVYAQITADGNDTGDDDKCIALGAVECVWVHDPENQSVFTTGGSKDDLDVPNWRYTNSSVPDADEILDAFAAKYIIPDGQPGAGDQVLYFGADRLAVNGSKDFGFWFFRNPVGLNGDGTFSGQHSGTLAAPGDILILGTFTQGGAATNIRVFRWVGTGGNATANGTVQGPDAAFADCVPGQANDNGCGTVNDTTIPSPWPFLAKGEAQQMQIPSGGLLEGGIDLTAIGLAGCFSSFVAETRSAPSVDAQLKDFVLGNFEACDTSVTTTPANGSGTALTDNDDPADGVPDTQIGTGSAGVNVTDTASVVVNGLPTWSGTVAFSICGPIATGTCETGGVAAGTKNVSDTTTTATSNVVNLTSVGRYCWRGDFTPSTASAAAGLKAASDSSTGECFQVKPVKPTLDTDAGDGPVDFGQPVTDTASLSGTANKPGANGGNTTYPSINATDGGVAGGTITFSLYGPDSCTTLAAGFATAHPNGIQRTVTGDDTYPTASQAGVSFTPQAPGTYHWKASYGGDSPNTLASGEHNTLCDDTDESVVVRQIPTQIKSKQSWFPNDTATITSSVAGDNLGAGGSVAFGLYDNATCTGSPVFSQTKTLTGGANSETVSTTNSTFEITTGFDDTAASVKSYSWKIVYTPAAADTAHTGKQSACHAENFSITYTNDPGPGTALP